MCADEAVQPQLTTEDDPKGKGIASATSTADADQTEGLEGEEDEEDDEDEEDEEGSADDMQLAYENLEVARAIYSRKQDTCTKELAGDKIPPGLWALIIVIVICAHAIPCALVLFLV